MTYYADKDQTDEGRFDVDQVDVNQADKDQTAEDQTAASRAGMVQRSSHSACSGLRWVPEAKSVTE
jgi:hypothetical protein